MAADEIRAHYDDLDQVVSRFSNQASSVQELMQKVRSSHDKLAEAWEGRGSAAFKNEMQSDLFPAINRLQEALQRASETTKQISQLMKQAEEEASSRFRSK